MIKFLFATLIIYTVYRLWNRAGRRRARPNGPADNAVSIAAPAEMVACSRCGTFVLSTEAMYSGAETFCSEGCLRGN